MGLSFATLIGYYIIAFDFDMAIRGVIRLDSGALWMSRDGIVGTLYNCRDE